MPQRAIQISSASGTASAWQRPPCETGGTVELAQQEKLDLGQLADARPDPQVVAKCAAMAHQVASRHRMRPRVRSAGIAVEQCADPEKEPQRRGSRAEPRTEFAIHMPPFSGPRLRKSARYSVRARMRRAVIAVQLASRCIRSAGITCLSTSRHIKYLLVIILLILIFLQSVKVSGSGCCLPKRADCTGPSRAPGHRRRSPRPPRPRAPALWRTSRVRARASGAAGSRAGRRLRPDGPDLSARG